MDSKINCNFTEAMQKVEGLIIDNLPPASQPSTFWNYCSKEEAILHDLSRFGLFRLHVQNVLGSVDREYWIKAVENQAAQRGMQVDWDRAGICAYDDFQEVHNLWIVWKEVKNDES